MRRMIACTVAVLGLAMTSPIALAQSVVKEGEKILLDGAKSSIMPAAPGGAATGPGAAGTATAVPGTQGVTTPVQGAQGVTTVIPGGSAVTSKIPGVPGGAAAMAGDAATTAPG